MMARTFKAKLRRLGNSLAVIVPREVVEEAKAKEGDVIVVTIPPTLERRKAIFRKIAGIDKGAGPFEREKRDRVDDY